MRPLVMGLRRAMDAQELSREAQQHTHRSVSYCYAEDGSLILKCHLPADAARVPRRERQRAPLCLATATPEYGFVFVSRISCHLQWNDAAPRYMHDSTASDPISRFWHPDLTVYGRVTIMVIH